MLNYSEKKLNAKKGALAYLLFSLALLLTTSFSAEAQSVGMSGAPCVGTDIVFYLQGNCSSTFWSVGGGTITSGQNTSSIHATFSSAGSYTVYAHSTCNNGVSNYYYNYPTIGNTVTPTAALTISQPNTCQGSTITFTGSGTNGGSPSYVFYVDGSMVQSGSSNTYTTSALSAGNHSAYVTMGSSLACVTSTFATSSTHSFTIATPVSYTVAISGPALICSSNPTATFYANPSNFYGTVTYLWYVNGGPVSGATSQIFTTNVSQGNQVYCVVNENYSCIAAEQVQSNTYTVNLTTSVTPTVGVQVSPLSYCAGATINVTATGVGATNYQWLVNGSQFQSSASSTASLGPSYTNTEGSYTISVNATGISGDCLSSTSASGASPSLTVNPMLTPTASLSLSTTSSCQGGNITFTASSGNGGSPTYNFYIDGSSVQNGSSSTYSTSGIGAGSHSAYVIMTSSLSTCMTASSATSSTQSFTVTAPVSYTVAISGPALICSSNPTATFYANPSNFYGTVTYLWYVNGGPVSGATSQIFTTNVSQGNQVYCVVNENYSCITAEQVQSNTYTVNLTTSVTPTVGVQVSPLSYCAGATINVTATGVGATNYQWLVNGSQFQSSASSTASLGPSYTNTEGSYTISVNATGISGDCLSSTSASGASPSLTVNPMLTPTASLSLSTTSSCQGGNITFTASSGNGGSPTYNFYIDGSSVQNGSSSTYSTSDIGAGSHSAYVIMTSSLSTCMTASSATSSTQSFTVTAPVSYTVAISGPALICSSNPTATFYANPSNFYGTVTYLWYVNGGPVSGATSQIFTTNVSQGNQVYCVVNENYSCITAEQVQSNTYTVNLTTSVTPTVGVQVSPLSYCAGATINVTATGVGATNYQWLVNGSQFQSSASSTASLGPSYTNTEGSYTISVNATGISGDCLSSTSASGASPTLSVSAPTVAGTLGAITSSFCNNGTVTLGVTGNTGSITRYLVQSQDNGGAWTVWTTTTATPSVTTSPGINRVYNFQAFVQNGTCLEVGTNIVSTTVYFSNSMGTLSVSTSLICASSGSVTLSLASLTTENAAWQYRYSDNGGTSYNSWTTFSSVVSTSQSYTLTGTSSLRLYQFQVTASNSTCAPVTSNSVTVKISAVPVASASNQAIFTATSTSIALTSTVPSTTFSFSPQTPTNVTGASASSGSQIAQSLHVTDGINPGSVKYNVAPTANGCPGSTVTVTASVYPTPVITASANRLTMGPVSMSVQSFYDTYTWKNSAGQTVATTQSFQVMAPSIYTVTVTKASSPTTLSKTSPAYTIVGQFSGQSANYIVTNMLMVDGTSPSASLDALPPTSTVQSIQYFDGLGRSLQTVGTKASPTGNDLVQPNVYDQYGREFRKYLPFSYGNSNPGWLNNNIFDTNLNYINAAANFYNTPLSKVATDSRYFSETTQYEPSPLMRPLQDFGPGNNWFTNNASVNHSYLINQAGSTQGQDNITVWSIATVSINAKNYNVVNQNGYWPSNSFTVNVTVDENGNQVRQYTDRQGRMLVRKVQYVSGSNPTTYDDTQWAITYYVYDDFDRLSFVLQPEFNNQLPFYLGGNNQWKVNMIASLAFKYTYDARGRLITKQVPGKGMEYMVYDQRDRLVMTQDSVQRTNNQWLITKYDSLDRPVITATYNPGSAVTLGAMAGMIGKNKFCEYYGSAFATNYGYSNNVFPQSNLSVLTVNYYDNYNFINDLSFGTSYNFVSTDISGQQTSYYTHTTSLPTGSQVNVLGTTNFLYSVLYYDSKHRVIQNISQNNKGGWDRITNVVDFPGRVLNRRTTHHTSTHNNDQNIARRYTYDQMSRPTAVFHEIGEAVVWTALVNATFTATTNTLAKSTSTTGWDAGAFSQNSIPANTDGWVEFKVNSATTYKLIGLATSNPDASYASINFSIDLTSAGVVYVYESGVNKGTYGSYTASDVFRVERKSGVVNYKKNGVIFYTSATASTTVLYVDCSLDTSGAAFVDTRIGKGAEVQLVAYKYNEIGQPVTKSLYSYNGGTSFTQNVDYRYTIRGWMQSMNNSQLASDGGVTNNDNNDLFGMELAYNTAFTTGTTTSNNPQYNGNISAMKWSSNNGNFITGFGKDVGYNYSYDPLNRIMAASYLKDVSNIWSNATSAFSESGYAYDRNGNITSLIRNSSSGSAMDNLSYRYTGNQLLSVSDAGDVTKGFIDGNTTGNDYGYDPNGNMAFDNNKSLTATNAIQYNYLNLPIQVTKSTNEKIIYTYDAGGRKLTQQVYNASGTLTKTTEYDGEFIYQGDTLQFINHDEGRVVMKGIVTTPEYQYHLKDHLGNVRVTFTTQTKVKSSTAGFETANQATEASNFSNYPSGSHINTVATNAHSGTNSLYLNGGISGQIGISKSFSVMPGDVVSIQAYAKYSTPSGTASNYTALIASLLGAFNLSAPAPGEVGTAASGVNTFGNWELSATGDEDKSDAMKIFATIIIFDRNYNFVDVAYQAIQSGGSMNPTYTIKQPGYAYLYVSNEHPYLTDVYFDDVTMTLTPSPLVQMEDFYPFGLSFNSATRQNTVPQNYLYNGKEQLNDLAIDWYDYGARMYMPEIGRWGVVDQLAEYAARTSPYAYGYDNPVRFTDPTGMANEDETSRESYQGSDGAWHVDIHYGTGGGLGDSGGGDQGPGQGSQVKAKQDATRGNESSSARRFEIQKQIVTDQLSKAKLDRLKQWINNARKTVDFSDRAYKTSPTNFQAVNKNLGSALKGAGIAGSVTSILVAVSEQDKDEFFKEFGELIISLTPAGEGYSLLSLSAETLKLIGEDGDWDYLNQLHSQVQGLYERAASYPNGSDARQYITDQVKPYEIEERDVRKRVLSRLIQ